VSIFPPKESPIKKGFHFLNMSLILKVLLGHIAAYLLLLPDAPSFWFTLNTSYDHFFHLQQLSSLSLLLLPPSPLSSSPLPQTFPHVGSGGSGGRGKAEATVRSFAARHFPDASSSLLSLIPCCQRRRGFWRCHRRRFRRRCCFRRHRRCVPAVSSAAALS
jgi:hypothetical protein